MRVNDVAQYGPTIADLGTRLGCVTCNPSHTPSIVDERPASENTPCRKRVRPTVFSFVDPEHADLNQTIEIKAINRSIMLDC